VRAGRPGYFPAPGSERFEEGIEMIDDLTFPADHLTVTTFESPHASARADIDVIEAPAFQLFCSPNVVYVVGVAAIDDDVARFHVSGEFLDGAVNDGRRNHQPGRSRRSKFAHKIIKRVRCNGSFMLHLAHTG